MKNSSTTGCFGFSIGMEYSIARREISLLVKDATNPLYQQQPLASQCLEGSGDPEHCSLQIESLDLEFSASSEPVVVFFLVFVVVVYFWWGDFDNVFAGVKVDGVRESSRRENLLKVSMNE